MHMCLTLTFFGELVLHTWTSRGRSCTWLVVVVVVVVVFVSLSEMKSRPKGSSGYMGWFRFRWSWILTKSLKLSPMKQQLTIIDVLNPHDQSLAYNCMLLRTSLVRYCY